MQNKPVIFLAFANDRVDDASYLRNLPKELAGIREALLAAQEHGLCEVVERANLTAQAIFDVFQSKLYHDRIAVFHYGGHANGYQLLLETVQGNAHGAFGDALASFLAKQKGLQLVFLNGCSTKNQAQGLIAAGIPAVIGTSQSINDETASSLSVRFYGGLAKGLSLQRAWQEAVDEVSMIQGGPSRALFWEGFEGETESFPWELYFKEGAENARSWNLPEQADNPLFNLPPIPISHSLPDSPFLFLRRYEREHAQLFLGRSYYIRELYDSITDPTTPHLILLYGQSGVGKSSLFDAGVLPRMEDEYEVVYVRRSQRLGLEGSLNKALKTMLEKYGVCVGEQQSPGTATQAPASTEKSTDKRRLELLLTRAIDGLDENQRGPARLLLEALKTQELKTVPAIGEGAAPVSGNHFLPEMGLTALWKEAEARSGKPLAVFLDQVEEIFTRPLKEADELASFALFLSELFGNPAALPKGALILGYRKEYNPEIEAALKKHQVPRSRIFLEHLKKRDIADIFNGLARAQGLKERYRIRVEETLPFIIADDLLEDKNSSVAPVLQILMTKMWQAALAENPEAPYFSIKLYQDLKAKGILLEDFFFQQMRKLRLLEAGAEESGLALDILFSHTTDLGTAGSCSQTELEAKYAHSLEAVRRLLPRFKELYLLNDMGGGVSILAHDTIAPLVQKVYRTSERAGQRAARTLENQYREFVADAGNLLDEDSLNSVEAGKLGMREWTQTEGKLIEKSKEARERAKDKRRRYQRLGVAVFVLMLTAAFLGAVQWKSSKELLHTLAEKNMLTQAQHFAVSNPSLALQMAVINYENVDKKYEIAPQLRQVLRECSQKPMYGKVFVHKDRIDWADCSPDNKYMLTLNASTRTVNLWNIEKGTHEIVHRGFSELMAVAFTQSGDMQIIYETGERKLAASRLGFGKKSSFPYWPSGEKWEATPLRLAGPTKVFIKGQDLLLADFTQGHVKKSKRFWADGFKLIAASEDFQRFFAVPQVAAKGFGLYRSEAGTDTIPLSERITEAVFLNPAGDLLMLPENGQPLLYKAGDKTIAPFSDRPDFICRRFSLSAKGLLAAEMKDNSVQVFDAEKKLRYLFADHDPGKALFFSADGQKLFKITENDKIKMWETDKPVSVEFVERLNLEFIRHIQTACFVPGNKGLLYELNPKPFKWRYRFGVDTAFAEAALAAPLAKIWQNRPLLLPAALPFDSLRWFAPSPDGRRLLAASKSAIYAFDSTGKFLFHNTLPDQMPLEDDIQGLLKNEGKGGSVVLASRGTLLGLDDSLKITVSLPLPSFSKERPVAAARSREGKYLALANKHDLYLWDSASNYLEMIPLDKNFGPVLDMAFPERADKILLIHENGISEYSLLSHFFASLKKNNEFNLYSESATYLRELDGDIVYSFDDVVFFNKIFIFMLLGMVGFALINQVLVDYDKGLLLKAAVESPVYLLFLTVAMVMVETADTERLLQETITELMIIFFALFIAMLFHELKRFRQTKQSLWYLFYLSSGIFMTALLCYFVYANLSLFFTQAMYIAALTYFLIAVSLLAPLRFGFWAWYSGRKKFFYVAMGIFALFLIGYTSLFW